MSRRCILTGKKTVFGNHVSHANNKTRRRFLPNLQQATLYSESLGQLIHLRVTTHALRCLEHKGGFDSFLIQTKNIHLGTKARLLKKRILAARNSS